MIGREEEEDEKTVAKLLSTFLIPHVSKEALRREGNIRLFLVSFSDVTAATLLASSSSINVWRSV